MRSRVFDAVKRPSVCRSVWLPPAAAAGLLLWAWWPGDIDQLLLGQHSAANVSSVISADVGSLFLLPYNVKCYLDTEFSIW